MYRVKEITRRPGPVPGTKEIEKMKTDILKQMMNAKIGAIAGTTVDVTVLAGRKKGGIYLTVEIEGNNTDAVSKIKNFFGAKFDGSEYDQELEYTYVGIELE